jgi:hypothetical protein
MNRDRVGEYQSPKIDLQFGTQRLRHIEPPGACVLMGWA